MPRFTEILLPDFQFAEDDAADVIVTVSRNCGCDDVRWIEFAGYRMPFMSGAEKAKVEAWIDAHEHEFGTMIEEARERDREEVR